VALDRRPDSLPAMMNIQFLGSPNFAPGRNGHNLVTEPRFVVIHTMVGTIASANARFQQASEQASAHYGVGLDGRIVQWVREEDAAFHAGDFVVNLDSIGIEHEDGGRFDDPRPDALYRASAELVGDICRRCGMPIDAQHIRPHRDFSATRCPDALDVARIIREANSGPQPQQQRTHVVQAGDTMAAIARAFGVPLDALEQANPELERGQQWNHIVPGDVVRIP
jgi:N-acetylmuramoyl-L-alanine amidase